MNNKYGKAYNVKIYKKPEIKYYKCNNEKNIKKRYFIYNYLSEEKIKFKKGDYLIVEYGHGNIAVLHITKFEKRCPIRVRFGNSKYVIPVSRNYVYDCSIFTLDNDSCYYSSEHKFKRYGKQYFITLSQNQIKPKVLNVMSNAKSSDVKLLYKIYLEEYKETTNK